MSRGRKLLIAGLVLVVGIGLAWPFRKTTADKSLESVAGAPSVDLNQSQREAIERPIAALQFLGKALVPDKGLGQPRQMRSPAPHVAAKMTSIGEALIPSAATGPSASFDLANHPALAGLPGPQGASPVTPPIPRERQVPREGYLPAQLKSSHGAARPAYATADRNHSFDTTEQPLTEVRHVVQNSDTLEKLAARYLGDKGRALEIFDLNRDVLNNPHLLPIDAQLRIPRRTPVDAGQSMRE